MDITPPDFFEGVALDRMNGVTFVNTFDNADVESERTVQYFEIMGSRGMYKDGWFAGTFGSRVPWNLAASHLAGWNPEKDVWELYNIDADFSQAHDLAKKNPKKLREMKDAFIYYLYLRVKSEN